MKKSFIAIYKNAVVARMHNRKIVASKIRENTTQIRIFNANERKKWDKQPTCLFERVRGVNIATFNLSDEAVDALIELLITHKQTK